jgi:predicted MFS family arabinose efflux permease
MVVGRVLTGIGSGLAISGANAAVAARKDAERIFAIIWTLGGGITASLSIWLPGIVAGGNYPMGFGVLLLLCVAGIPFMVWVPPRPHDSSPPTGAATDGDVGGATLHRQVFGPATWLALLGILIYSAAEQALWNFAYNLPIEAGIPENRVNWILGSATGMGLIGGAVAAWLGVRLGRVIPVVIGSLLSVFGRWIYIDATEPDWLFVGALLWGVGFYFVSPYQIGLLAALDRTGRLAVAAGGLMNFGYAIGPTIGGRVLQHLDLGALIIVVAGATLLSMLLILPLAIRIDRASRDPAAVP